MKNTKSEYHFIIELGMIFRLKDAVRQEKTICRAILGIRIIRLIYFNICVEFSTFI